MQLISVRQNPAYKDKAIAYFQQNWSSVWPIMYEDCISQCIGARNNLPQWYLLEKDGELIGARQQERFTRIKHDQAFPNHALEAGSSISGIGATPEGIDHNPIYFDLLFEQNFRSTPVPDLFDYLIKLAHKRYGLRTTNEDVTTAWKHLSASFYSQGFSVQDRTGVAHLNPSESSSLFEKDRNEPKQISCDVFLAYKHLALVGLAIDESAADLYLYDLVSDNCATGAAFAGRNPQEFSAFLGQCWKGSSSSAIGAHGTQFF